MPPYKRLVRRPPLMQRIKAYLDPWDFLLWLSEELETGEWEQWQSDWAAPLGIAINLLMVVARANSGGTSRSQDDVFGDDVPRTGFLTWLATFIVHLLTLLSVANALYTFLRARHYRLFETPVDEPPSTPSARRVHIDSSPARASPLRLLTALLPSASDPAAAARARAHPDPTRDVWELAVWDPLPLCLRTFCLFSPGHALVYWHLLPAAPDGRPGFAAATALLVAALLSAQLWLLQRSFTRQAQDAALVHREVLHEYDHKFVHPRTRRLARDVGTQFAAPAAAGRQAARRRRSGEYVDPASLANSVEVHRPRVATDFRVRPNPNYAAWTDPDGRGYAETPSRRPAQHDVGVGMQTPAPALQPTARPPNPREFSSPLRERPLAAAQARPQPAYRASTGAGGGDGGNLGVYSHAHSPLKKAASTHFGPGRQVRDGPRRESGRF